jgi:hypothetical protein
LSASAIRLTSAKQASKVVRVSKAEPSCLALVASTGQSKKSQTCAPFPDRERSATAGTLKPPARGSKSYGVGHTRLLVEIQCKKPTGFVRQKRVDADSLFSGKVVTDRTVREWLKQEGNFSLWGQSLDC